MTIGSRPSVLTAASLLLIVLMTGGCQKEKPLPAPPQTRVEEVVEEIHGVRVADPYRWLEDQQSPETRAWIAAQNAYTDSLLDALPGREQLERRLTPLLQTASAAAPLHRAGRYFFLRRAADQDLYVIYMRDGAGGEDQVLIDPHPWTEDHTRSVDLADVSDDGKLMLYAVRQGGQDEVEYRILDVDRGEDLPDVLPRARYFNAEFTPDGKGLYYARYGEQGTTIFFHALGSDPSRDEALFGEGFGPDELIISSLSDDGAFLVVHVLHGSAGPTEIYVKDLRRGGPFRVAVADQDSRSFGQVVEGRLVVQTNWQAPAGRVMAVDARDPAQEKWREIVPERKDAVIRSIALVGGRLFVNYLENVVTRLRSFDLAGREVGEIHFDDLGTVSNLQGRWKDPEAFFSFQSFHIPSTIYRFDVASGKRSIWFRADLPVDPTRYQVEQLWFESKDGTRIPLFLVRRKDLAGDGPRPLLLNGYGGFEVSKLPRFSPTTIPWLDAGGLYAVANIRGGGEFGENWHRAGMLENKQNTFDDFIAAAEFLIDEGYTNSDRLAISGGSNGGLLVGAVMTQRPELVRAVICAYPLLDMVRYHKFLVARFWVPEYGSADDPEQFETLYAYSPYHHVRPGTEYPALLMITGDGDTRVAPLHGRKMVAAVQAANTANRPILLRYHIKAGHAGGTPVSEQIEDAVDTYSFLAWQLGLEEASR